MNDEAANPGGVGSSSFDTRCAPANSTCGCPATHIASTDDLFDLALSARPVIDEHCTTAWQRAGRRLLFHGPSKRGGDAQCQYCANGTCGECRFHWQAHPQLLSATANAGGLASQEQVAAQSERDEADADCLGDDQRPPQGLDAGMVSVAFVRRHLLAHGDLLGVESG